MLKTSLFSRSEKFLIAALAFIQFSHIVDFMIMMPLGPKLMRNFAITPQQFGLLVSSYTFAAGFTGICAAFFVDRFDRKTSLLFFYSGFSIGTIACAMAGDYTGLLLTRTLTGAFGGVLSSLSLSIISDRIDAQRRGTAMGLMMMSFSAASVIGVPFSLFLANHWDWHAPFTFLGSLSLLLIGLIMYSVPKMQGHLAGQNLNEAFWKPVWRILKNSSQTTALLFMVLLVLGQFSVIPFLSPSMVANAGLLETQLPLIYLVGGLCSIVSGPLIGRASDLHGKRKVFFIGASISLAPILLVTNMTPQPLPLILGSVAFFFICMGARMIPATALISETVHPQQRGTFMSLVSSVQQFSSAAGSLIAGAIVTTGPGGRLMNYPYVGFFAVCCSVIAILMSRQIRVIEGN